MRVTICASPEVHGGRPCFAGTRLPVGALFSFIAAGATDEEIGREYPGAAQVWIEMARLLYIEAHTTGQEDRT